MGFAIAHMCHRWVKNLDSERRVSEANESKFSGAYIGLAPYIVLLFLFFRGCYRKLVTLHGERSDPCNEAWRVKSCERGDAYSEAKSITELYALAYSSVASQCITQLPFAGSICFALGNKNGSFCEAVNCEQSEQVGKFLFAMLVSIRWFPPPSKASWHNARESAESGGTIYYKHYYGNKLFE